MDCVQVTVCLDCILGIIILLLILILSVVRKQGPGSRERIAEASDSSERDDGDCSAKQNSTNTLETRVEMTEAQIYELNADFYDRMDKDELHNLDNYLDQE